MSPDNVVTLGRILLQVEEGALRIVGMFGIVIVNQFPVPVAPGGEVAAAVPVGEVVEEGVPMPRVVVSAEEAP